MESFIAKENIKTGDMVVSEGGYILRARPSDPKPNRIEKLPTTWQPNKDVIVIKVNELIDVIRELQEAVKPAEGELDLYECQRKTINILRKDVAKARLEGIEWVLKIYDTKTAWIVEVLEEVSRLKEALKK
jgi:hypothetical protein